MAKNKSSMPLGVKILAIISYIGAAVTLLGAIAMFVGSAFVGVMLSNIPGYTAIIGAAGTAFAIVMGVILIAFAVLDFFIGKGLWNGKKWARIVVLVLASLAVLSSLWPFQIVSIIIYGVVIWYLGFNKEAVKYFK